MKVIVTENKIQCGAKAFEIFKNEIKNGAKVLGLATGSTPETLYQNFINSDLNCSNLISINLDEYVGLTPDNPQSYHYFMRKHLFDKKPFKKSYVPDGMTKDVAATCKEYDQIIKDNPIDVQLLGIGRNGHIAFNEPGTPFDIGTHEVKLTENTIKANSRFFDNEDEVPKSAICMGTANIMDAKKVVLMAFGEKKAQAIKEMIEGPVTEQVPASILQKHPDVTVIVDKAAAQELDDKYKN
ncbi:glucosamine-6-phosphate deaminase [Lactobacillus helveticus]|uniref:Glucosamine-6-phosphate deaminase n=1 Tax=Lactobacillus helveticus CIRM-BIA 953 TaxID=1226335 RepID=U4QLE5_LACHE|nr:MULTISPECIES: glucosamine-6-phosphate deaminase [Lactobacillus]MCO0807104.1 glucosamine-6-phosphate deaminase [Lactobacillus helveticus]MCP9317381.1 glucosamine-6-phosphate deaminase [Lactobacillus helveticus]MDH5818379.1 glucosamine-6-phosphate deaminase [Lactobacillus helveticus]MDN5583714.1 glucosamine-6-phosphate deaminase [Lactobacillus sp.]MDN5955556.1 glucosamine-6-phosphate deaminase [Lactobacillus sp.]